MTASFRMAAILAAATVPTLLGAQQQAPAAAVRSVPVSNLRYEITFDSATARRHIIAVAVNLGRSRAGPRLRPSRRSLSWPH